MSDAKNTSEWLDPDVRFGNPEEWVAFGQRRPKVVQIVPRIAQALTAVFSRSLTDATPDDLVIFFTGYRCAEDFLEILLLCGNGEGYAGQKLLRSLFENVVLVKYLNEHRDQVRSYYDYHDVTTFKHINVRRRFWGNEAVPQKVAEQATANYEAIKENYRHRTCQECGRKEMGVSWTPIALPDMAELVGLGNFVPTAYYEPLLDSHPNMNGIVRRLDFIDLQSSKINWSPRLNRELADRVLLTAHALLLCALEVQQNYFSLPDTVLDGLPDDFVRAWDAPAARGLAPQPVEL